MFKQLEELFSWQSELLKAKRYDELADQQIYPFALFRQNRQVIIRNADEAVDMLIKLRAGLVSRGVKRVTTRVTAVDLPRNGRFRVWLLHEAFDAAGAVLGSTGVVQYCVETPRGTKTEMTEYAHCSLPEIWERPVEVRKLA